MITLTCTTFELSPERAAIAARLELEYEQQTEILARLMSPRSRRPHRGDRSRIADHSAAIISARAALADAAQALRRLADGSYGRCEECFEDIPVDDLESRPAARWCTSCERRAAY